MTLIEVVAIGFDEVSRFQCGQFYIGKAAPVAGRRWQRRQRSFGEHVGVPTAHVGDGVEGAAVVWDYVARPGEVAAVVHWQGFGLVLLFWIMLL